MRYLALILLMYCLPLHAQEVLQEASPADTVYSIVQEMPEFTGGDPLAYIRKNFSLDSASLPGCHKITISFIVDKNGNTTDVKFDHNKDVIVHKQALEIISQMKWRPGKQYGKAVNVKYVIPLRITTE